jgi:hypothetical protein
MPAVRLRILAAVFSTGLALAAVAAAAAAPGPIASLPPGWSHAEVNVTINGQTHTLIYDRGRVQSVSSSSLVLKERDGSIVSIPVGPKTRVRVNGQPASLTDVLQGYSAWTLRVDGGPARLVRAFAPRRAR